MDRKTQEGITQAILTGRGDNVLSILYKEILPKIKNLVIKNNGNEDEAKDIFQDAVIILYKQVRNGNFNSSEDLEGYIYIIAKHLWMKRVRKINKNINIDQTDIPQNLNNEILDVYISKEKEAAIKNIMSKVGDECKELFSLVMYEKLSMKEICKKMGYSSENVAKTYHYRCKKKLAEMVKNHPDIIELYQV
jgi:RNA polymerase sigma factor (sigma-70 family)